ncbi:alpha/beta hydrolase-fold protein [Nakamurella deserti]|uniref:alpha/beta hydrolase-fold protein n=1 Tax=Nakamurella deserti TaxID=2164074 RepID=UPI0013008467|nr:alpha/beta hydrolase-fold protein [Nakamurella deserti]
MPTGAETRTDGPVVSALGVRLHLPASVAALDGVELDVDFPLHAGTRFVADGRGGWELNLHRPAVQRFEYRLRMRSNGRTVIDVDPTNPLQVAGPFGPLSEIRFPAYEMPSWLDTPERGSTVTVADPPGALPRPVPVRLFSPAALEPMAPAPLLVAHDGSDLARRGCLLQWACAQERPVRVALLDPPEGFRHTWYAADPGYADHIGAALVPHLRSLVPTTSVIGLGASLGGLITLLIHRRHPRAFDAMALQSGSFFRRELDGQESQWTDFTRVCTAVERMAEAPAADVRPVPTLLTVGAVEENRANNERMAGALAFQRYPLDARIVPDAHNVIGWRDAWSPGLDDLLTRLP